MSVGMSFWLSMEGESIDRSRIERELNIRLDFLDRIDAPEELPEKPSGPVFYKQIDWLLDLVENNRDVFAEAGVDISESAVWMVYCYDKQCSMEFDADLLERMGRLGLKLCISCQEIT